MRFSSRFDVLRAMACPVAVFVREHRRPWRKRSLRRRKNLAAAGRGRDVRWTWPGCDRDVGRTSGRSLCTIAPAVQAAQPRAAIRCVSATRDKLVQRPASWWPACLRHPRLPWRPTQEPLMKRKSQNRIGVRNGPGRHPMVPAPAPGWHGLARTTPCEAYHAVGSRPSTWRRPAR